ncbi:MAG: DoxX family protein [Acidobacteriota bacterium]|jgi:putative oxidoreductase
MKKLIFGGDSDHSFWGSIGVTAIRVFAGLALALAHGRGKLPPSEGFIEGVVKMGFPMPIVFAWAAALSEFAGGILLALGLATRLASFFIICTMTVALLFVHGADPFAKQEMAFLYLFIAIFFLFRGAGNISADGLIRGK